MMGYALIFGLPVRIPLRAEPPLTVLTLQAPPLPDQPPKPVEPAKRSNASRPASPRNLENKATAVVAPPPLVLPPPIPVISAREAGAGTAASAGASDRPGPGFSAGGQGNGSGEGGDGDGDDGGNVPPRLVKGRIKATDLPADLRNVPIEGTVSVRYDIDTNGRVGNCVTTGSSGTAELDQLTCRLIQQRFRYDPSRNSNGEPVPSTIEEDHHWHNDGFVDPPTTP